MSINSMLRLQAFNWLEDQTNYHGDVLPRTLLEQGFIFNGYRVPLVSPQGIFKPKLLDLPLSITTSPNSPYDDSIHDDGYILYKYRGTDPYHRDNVGLRKAMMQKIPLVYFHGIIPGRYFAEWPVFIVGDSPDQLTFTVAVDDMNFVHSHLSDATKVAEPSEGKRMYITSITKRRLHQRGFRERVMIAYQTQCAVCRFKHRELLDAAHIIPDKNDGAPIVSNGLSLCKLHHAAYDKNFLGITPDYEIVVRGDLLREIDGPMLRHGMQEMHQTKILLPRRKDERPDRDSLARRFAEFESAL